MRCIFEMLFYTRLESLKDLTQCYDFICFARIYTFLLYIYSIYIYKCALSLTLSYSWRNGAMPPPRPRIPHRRPVYRRQQYAIRDIVRLAHITSDLKKKKMPKLYKRNFMVLCGFSKTTLSYTQYPNRILYK